jgi:hypothetical protein
MEAEVYLPVPQGKYVVRCNGEVIRTSRVKGEAFLFAGRLGAGSYEVEVE